MAKRTARAGVWRWLFTALCTASLVLWVGVVALWVRSYWRMDYWSLRRTSYSFPDEKVRDGMRIFSTESRRLRIVESSMGYVQVLWAEQDFLVNPMRWRVSADAPATAEIKQFWSTPKVRRLDPRRPTTFSLLGFAYSSEERTIPTMGKTETRSARGVRVPFWLPTLLLAVLPAWWVRLARRRRKRGAGFCATCGYDLRATPGRCPECGAGMEIAEARSAASGEAFENPATAM